IRPHPRTLRRHHAQPQRAAVRRHLRPPPACELRLQVIVARGDPHGNPAVDELDHSRIEHGRQLRPLHEKEPTPLDDPVAWHGTRSRTRAWGTRSSAMPTAFASDPVDRAAGPTSVLVPAVPFKSCSVSAHWLVASTTPSTIGEAFT